MRLLVSRKRVKGFTLIELLVVIAIIAILAAILFPVFAKAREKARQSTCSSNQRQIAAAIQMYAQDHEELLPSTATVWRDLTLDSGVLICPTKGKNTPNAYGYNQTISATALGKIDDPTSTPLTCDTLNITTNILTGGGDVDRRHTNKTIAAYVDGHVTATDFLGLITYQENFSANTLSNGLWTLPPSPTNCNAAIANTGTNYYIHGYPGSPTPVDGSPAFITLPANNIIRGNFRFELDMEITGSALTPIYLSNSKTTMQIISLYHHNSGNAWAITTGTTAFPTQVWFAPGLFYNSGVQYKDYAVPYNTWGHFIFLRMGNQMTLTASPLPQGQTMTWNWTAPTDDVDTIGFATRFGGAGQVYWDNLKCTQ